ncbi:MAG: AEC family transporter [Asticcacaulis sp.]
MALIHILAIIAPIFILIAVGFAALRLRLIRAGGVRILGAFVINFTLPALIFQAVATRDFREILRWDYLAAYGSASLALMIAGIVQAVWLRGKSLPEGAMQGLGMSLSNSAFIGYPIAVQLLGPVASLALALNQLVGNLVILPLTLIVAESGGRGSDSRQAIVMKVAERLVRNPILLAIVAAVFVSSLDLTLPQPLDQALDLMAKGSSATALFVIGATLAGHTLTGIAADVSLVTFGKLVVHPALVFAISFMVPNLDPHLRAAAIIMAATPMLSIYPIIGQAYRLEGVCAATQTISMVASFFTITIVLAMLGFGFAG